MNSRKEPDWQSLDAILRHDPGGRGVAAFQEGGRPLAAGHLERAAKHLAEDGQQVAIVTGFAIVGRDRIAAETDGPPGALYLARVLAALGVETTLITDRIAEPLLAAGCKFAGLHATKLLEFPMSGDVAAAQAWIDEYLASRDGRELTHLVSIERVGPSHTLESLAAQQRIGAAPLAEFEREVPPEHRDRCHNMRGIVIDESTAPIHRLFEAVAGRRPEVKTIGVADGGNEIGMGAVAWEVARRAIARGPAAEVACRIACDHLILAGVSNFGGYALAGAVAALRGRSDLVSAWTAEQERRLIESLVEAGAVDGVTGLSQPTVDGLPLDDYLATFDAICRSAA
jgi:hypothetical protein